MGLIEARMANRMEMRQSYRTAARMERRRAHMNASMGRSQDFQTRDQYAQTAPAPAAPAAAQPDYIAELERLAQLRDSGVITAADFDAKKAQLLGL